MKARFALRWLGMASLAWLWAGACFLIARSLPCAACSVVLFCFLVAPSWSYLMTPVYTLTGVFTYDSTFLRHCLEIGHFTENSEFVRRHFITLHLGTLYDVLWRVLPLRKQGESTACAVRREVYRGLAHLCRRINNGEMPKDSVILACSYFLPEAKMYRLGFRRDRSSSLTRMLGKKGPKFFLARYLDLMLTRTIILGRVRWFNPFRTAVYQMSATDFANHQELFERLAKID